jgi:hypothetical protein
MHLSFGYLKGDGISPPQIGGGKTFGPAIDTTAAQTIGTRQTKIQGNFADSLTEFLPTVIPKGAENRRDFSTFGHGGDETG